MPRPIVVPSAIAASPMRPLIVASVLLGLLSSLPHPAACQVRAWACVSLTASSFGMGDVNATIDELNSALALVDTRMSPTGHGYGYDMALRLDLCNSMSVGVAYTRLVASSALTPASFEFDLPANAVRLTGRYSLARFEHLKVGTEISGGLITSVGHIRLGPDDLQLAGSAPLLEVAGVMSYRGSPRCEVEVSAGYRSAAIPKIETPYGVVTKSTGGSFSLDYGGPFLRATVALGMFAAR